MTNATKEFKVLNTGDKLTGVYMDEAYFEGVIIDERTVYGSAEIRLYTVELEKEMNFLGSIREIGETIQIELNGYEVK